MDKLISSLEPQSWLHDGTLTNLTLDARSRRLVISAVGMSEAGEPVNVVAAFEGVFAISLTVPASNHMMSNYEFPINAEIDFLKFEVREGVINGTLVGLYGWKLEWRCESVGACT